MKLKSIALLMGLIFILILSSCSKNIYIDSTNLYGKWQGDGAFNNTKVRAEIGTLHFNFVIHKDHTVTGMIGGAEIVKSKIARHLTFKGRDGNNIKCKINGNINGLEHTKKRINILMYVEGKTEIRTNFYLGGRIGNLTLVKIAE